MENRRLKYRVRKQIRHLTAGFIMVICLCMSFGVFLVSAHENNQTDKTMMYTYYKSIEIQHGDTLWNIAEDTMTSEYDSIIEYIQVLKNINGLSSDKITAGQYLMVAYEDTEFIR